MPADDNTHALSHSTLLTVMAYVDERYLTQPYKLSGMLGRWFNQRALCLLTQLSGEKKVLQSSGETKVLHLSGKNAIQFMTLSYENSQGERTTATTDELKELFSLLAEGRKEHPLEKDVRELEETLLELDKDTDKEQKLRAKRGALRQEIDKLPKFIPQDMSSLDPSAKIQAKIAERGERKELSKKQQPILDELKKTGDQLKAIAEEKEKTRHELQAQIAAKNQEFTARGEKARALRDAIINTGPIEIDEDAIKAEYEGYKISQILHRPNHGTAHSLRAALYVPALYDFALKYGEIKCDFAPIELERLQQMMLFSVVGREDETGFAETGEAKGSRAYLRYRAASGKAYLDYSLAEHAVGRGLYLDEASNVVEKRIYQDALLVELMGQDALDPFSQISTPEILIQWVMKNQAPDWVSARESACRNEVEDDGGYQELDIDAQIKLLLEEERRESAVADIESCGYDDFFNDILAVAKFKKSMMCHAHGRDLYRCYRLTVEQGSKSPSMLDDFLGDLYVAGLFKSNVFKLPDVATILDDVFALNRYAFSLFEATGNKATCGMATLDEYENEKQPLLKNLEALCEKFFKACYDSMEGKVEFLKQEQAVDATKNRAPFVYDEENITVETLQAYFEYKVGHLIAESFFKQKNTPRYSAKAFNGWRDLASAALAVTPPEATDKRLLPMVHSCRYFDNEQGEKMVTLRFESEADAKAVHQLHRQFFPAEKEMPQGEISQQAGLHCIQLSYAQREAMVDARLFEYRQVKVPATHSTDDVDFGSDGADRVLSMMRNGYALVRNVNPADPKDFTYELSRLDNPQTVRGDGTSGKRPYYYDPRTREFKNRPLARRQARRYQPAIEGPEDRSNAHTYHDNTNGEKKEKNSLFTPKTACSLHSPYHNKPLFQGLPAVRWRYFPLTFIYDANEVDLKGERYIWRKTVISSLRHWRKNISSQKYLKNLFTLPDKGGDRKETGPEIVSRVQQDVYNVHLAFGVRTWFPTAHELEQFRQKAKKYESSVRKLIDNLEILGEDKTELLKPITKALLTVKRRLDLEVRSIEQPHSKLRAARYAVSLGELQQYVRENPDDTHKNEVLAALTKTALKGVMCDKDELFYRLNVLRHSIAMKEDYQYDLPIYIYRLSRPPYRYTESMIKDDLITALNTVASGSFPFDTKKYHCTVKRNGEEKPKSLAYQQSLLVDLFNLSGTINCANFRELTAACKAPLSEEDEQVAVDIMARLDIVGGLDRELEKVASMLADPDEAKQDAFFLRQIALGNIAVIDALIAQGYPLKLAVLEQAKGLAQKNMALAEARVPLAQDAASTCFADRLAMPRHLALGKKIQSVIGLYQAKAQENGAKDPVCFPTDMTSKELVKAVIATVKSNTRPPVIFSNQQRVEKLQKMVSAHPYSQSPFIRFLINSSVKQLDLLQPFLNLMTDELLADYLELKNIDSVERCMGVAIDFINDPRNDGNDIEPIFIRKIMALANVDDSAQVDAYKEFYRYCHQAGDTLFSGKTALTWLGELEATSLPLLSVLEENGEKLVDQYDFAMQTFAVFLLQKPLCLALLSPKNIAHLDSASQQKINLILSLSSDEQESIDATILVHALFTGRENTQTSLLAMIEKISDIDIFKKAIQEIFQAEDDDDEMAIIEKYLRQHQELTQRTAHNDFFSLPARNANDIGPFFNRRELPKKRGHLKKQLTDYIITLPDDALSGNDARIATGLVNYIDKNPTMKNLQAKLIKAKAMATEEGPLAKLLESLIGDLTFETTPGPRATH